MGKTAGRWTKEEHKKFVQGKIGAYLIKSYGSFKNLRKRLEESRRLRLIAFGSLNSISCLKVFHQNLKEAQRRLWSVP
jgi:hypothetical protein